LMVGEGSDGGVIGHEGSLCIQHTVYF